MIIYKIIYTKIIKPTYNLKVTFLKYHFLCKLMYEKKTYKNTISTGTAC